MLVKNGLGIEAFLDRLLATADGTQLRVIDSSAGITCPFTLTFQEITRWLSKLGG